MKQKVQLPMVFFSLVVLFSILSCSIFYVSLYPSSVQMLQKRNIFRQYLRSPSTADSITLVVNLPNRPRKWQQMQQHLTSRSSFFTHENLQRFDAVVGKQVNYFQLHLQGKLSDSAYRSLIYPRRVGGVYMTTGGMGCFLSHLAVWEKAVELNQPVIVFEDDIELVASFDSIFHRILKELPTDFGMFYFADMVNNTYTRASATSYSPSLNALDGNHWGTYAYMVSPGSAAILCQNVFPIKNQVDSYIINTVKEKKISVFRSKINLVTTDNSPDRLSDVQLNSKSIVMKRGLRIPLLFHIMDLPPLQDVEEFIFRLSYNKHKQKTNREIVVWNRTSNFNEIDDFKPSLLDKTDPIYAFNLIYLKLSILYYNGGIFMEPTYHARFKIVKTLKGLNGFLGIFYNKKGDLSIPLMGSVKGNVVLKKTLSRMKQQMVTNKEDPIMLSSVLTTIFQQECSSTNSPNSTLIFPIKILNQANLV